MDTEQHSDITASHVFHFVRSQPFLNLSMSDADGQPFGVVVLFDIDHEWSMYFFGDQLSHKHATLSSNPRFAATMYELGEMYVQMTGDVVMIDGGAAYDEAFERIIKKSSKIKNFWPPVLDLRKGDFMLYKLMPNWIRAFKLSDGPKGQEEAKFVEILNKSKGVFPEVLPEK